MGGKKRSTVTGRHRTEGLLGRMVGAGWWEQGMKQIRSFRARRGHQASLAISTEREKGEEEMDEYEQAENWSTLGNRRDLSVDCIGSSE